MRGSYEHLSMTYMSYIVSIYIILVTTKPIVFEMSENIFRLFYLEFFHYLSKKSEEALLDLNTTHWEHKLLEVLFLYLEYYISPA